MVGTSGEDSMNPLLYQRPFCMFIQQDLASLSAGNSSLFFIMEALLTADAKRQGYSPVYIW